MLKKASKRLMTAIISLVVSVILCVGVCLAWFAVNNKVGGEGMNSQLRGDDIISFKVTPYYLNKKPIRDGEKIIGYETLEDDAQTFKYFIADKGASGDTHTGNYDYEGTRIQDGLNDIDVDKTVIGDGKGIIDIVKNADGTIDLANSDTMRPYSLGGAFTTTVLFKLEYEIASDSEKDFRIYAECPCPLTNENANDPITRLKVAKIDGQDAYNSNLSNAVTLAKAKLNADNSYSTTESEAEAYTPFVNKDHEKSFRLPFYDKISKTTLTANDKGNLVGESYVMMDYDSERFAYLSALMLENGGSLSSKLNLLGDITFVMEEYDTTEKAEVESIALDTLAPNAVYTQTAGADVISNTWQFVVTYTDGSKKIVKKSVKHTGEELTVTGVDTSKAGTGTATVTYTGAKESCEVPYTVTEAVNVPVTGVTLNKTSTSIAVGATETLTAIIAPAEATNQTVSWTSSDGTVATVSGGVVTGVKEGTATITVTTADGGFTAECTVTVTAETTTVNVESVSLNKSELTLTVGGTETLTATVAPNDATDKTVTWASDNEGIATVSGGVVTAKAKGTATITVTTTDGKKTATCTITVENKNYTVTFNANGHGTAPDSQTVEEGGKATKPDDLTESGWTFGGWFTKDGTGDDWGVEFNFDSDTITENTTLYAKWTEESGGTVVAIFARDDSNTPLTLPDKVALTGSKHGYADKVTFTYNGETYSDPLKLESGTEVTITLGANQKVTIVTSKAGVILIDGKEQNTSGTLEITTLGEGTHTITKGDSMNLYYIIIEPVT